MLSKEEYSNIMNLARSDINNQHLAIFLLQGKGFSLDEITWFFIDNAKLKNDDYYTDNISSDGEIVLPDAIIFQNMTIRTYTESVDIDHSVGERVEIKIPDVKGKNWSNLSKSKQKELFNYIKEYISKILNGTN